MAIIPRSRAKNLVAKGDARIDGTVYHHNSTYGILTNFVQRRTDHWHIDDGDCRGIPGLAERDLCMYIIKPVDKCGDHRTGGLPSNISVRDIQKLNIPGVLQLTASDAVSGIITGLDGRFSTRKISFQNSLIPSAEQQNELA